MTPHEKAEMFADLLALVMSDSRPEKVRRCQTTTGSAMIVTTFDGQEINIVVTASRSITL